MLRVDQFQNRQTGELLAGFIVRSKAGKSVAMGILGRSCFATHKRYHNDRDLMAKVVKLTGTPEKGK